MRIALIGAVRRSPMRIFGILSISAVLMVGITILFYLRYLEPAFSSQHENAGLVTVIKMRPEQYPSVNDLGQNAMTATERKGLMYTVKTIHDPVNDAQ
jgi:hypothetical protein